MSRFLKRLSVIACPCLAFVFSFFVALTSQAGVGLEYIPKVNQIPRKLKEVGIEQHLGSSIDLNLTFQDEKGQTVPLKKYFNNGKPVVFFLVYYECPNLCTFVLNAGVDSMKGLKWSAGNEYEVVAVSINPHETPQLAAQKKASYMKMYGRPGNEDGWHFLVGKQPEISKLAEEIGFNYTWDKENKQYAHASAMYVLTPEGKISRYFFGIMYPTHDLKFALIEASHGHIGSLVDKVLLFCCPYDTTTGKYTLVASRMMTAGGAITVFILATFLFSAWYRERARTKA